MLKVLNFKTIFRVLKKRLREQNRVADVDVPNYPKIKKKKPLVHVTTGGSRQSVLGRTLLRKRQAALRS